MSGWVEAVASRHIHRIAVGALESALVIELDGDIFGAGGLIELGSGLIVL